jgi:general nucleoside transport system permease protein
MDYQTLLQILDSTVRMGTPLLLACLAGLFSERAGIFDIGLEGKMLVAAIHGVASITFRGNQLISGVALNFLASGITVLIAQSMFGQGGRTPPLTGDARFGPIDLPFAEAMRGVPIVGPFYAEVVSGHSILVYLALLAVPATSWVLYRTRFGLRLRAVGENPAAVDTAGVSVVGIRYAAVTITAILCGLAGAYMATALQAGFGREMISGRGYIALAALIFAKWKPWPALGATMLFGFFQALSLRPDVAEGLFGFKIPAPALEALPYVLTVLVLAGFVGKAIPPRAGGEPYVKER